ncbi:MAG: DUF4124 domain-containing protein [Gammaproteobacteria bacterium]
MKYTLIAASLMMLACGATAQADGVYKWVDAQGRVHYGDQPQSNKAQPLNIQSAPPVDEGLRQRREAMSKQPKAKPEAQKKQDDTISSAKEAREQITQNCERAKERLGKYAAAALLSDKGNDGEQRLLNEDERSKLIEETRGEVEKWCAP